MSNGANRLFKVMKQTSESTNITPSQLVSLTVKSINPLIFMRDDRLEITEEFCTFSKLVKKEDFEIGDIVLASVFNNGQVYFIEQNNADDTDIITKKDLENYAFANVETVTIINTNLNDYVKDGFYYFGVDYTPINIPVGSNGWLHVMITPGGAIKQIWYRHGTTNVNDYETYVRTRAGDETWSSWKQYQVEGEWQTATLASGVTASTSGLGGTKGIKYRKTGNHVFIRGSVSCTWDGSNTKVLTTLPTEYRPAYSYYKFVPLTGTNIARIYVNSSGNVSLEWVKKISDGSNVTTALAWLEIDLDFFTDLD